MDDLVTLRELEAQSGVSRSRLAYAADAYRILPVRRAGLVKLYAKADVPRLLAAVSRVAERRRVGL